MAEEPQTPKKMSLVGWVIFSLLIGMLAAAVIGYGIVLSRSPLPEMSVHGWVAMGLGVVFSLLIGCGLMWLSFYSSRHGYDDRADPGRRPSDGDQDHH